MAGHQEDAVYRGDYRDFPRQRAAMDRFMGMGRSQTMDTYDYSGSPPMIVDLWREKFCQHHTRCGMAFTVAMFLIVSLGLGAFAQRNTLGWLLSVCVHGAPGT